jgi:hypothetical protein
MSSRSAVGRIWLQLVVRHYCACRDGDEEARQKIFDIIDTLSDLYPEAIEAEIRTFVAEEGA